MVSRRASPVEPVVPPAQVPDAVDTDPHSVLPGGRWVPLAEHLADVERECRTLLGGLDPAPTSDQRAAVALAGRYQDLGKAHPTFVASLAHADGSAPEVGGPWAKSPGRAPLRHDPPHFRHKLVSALVLLDDTTGLLDGVAEPDLVTYLALAHHGKVRLTVRARPDEGPTPSSGSSTDHPRWRRHCRYSVRCRPGRSRSGRSGSGRGR